MSASDWWGWYLFCCETKSIGGADQDERRPIKWRGTLLTLLCASFIGSVVGLALIARGGAGLRSKLPFGSFLALAALFALFAGRPIFAWYGTLL